MQAKPKAAAERPKRKKRAQEKKEEKEEKEQKEEKDYLDEVCSMPVLLAVFVALCCLFLLTVVVVLFDVWCFYSVENHDAFVGGREDPRNARKSALGTLACSSCWLCVVVICCLLCALLLIHLVVFLRCFAVFLQFDNMLMTALKRVANEALLANVWLHFLVFCVVMYLLCCVVVLLFCAVVLISCCLVLAC